MTGVIELPGESEADTEKTGNEGVWGAAIYFEIEETAIFQEFVVPCKVLTHLFKK